jgi:hypothetical protein
VDISGGSAGAGKTMHLWDCDGGDSEKWFITTDGRFRSRQNTGYCATVPNGTLNTGVQLRTEVCGTASWQRFERVSVPDWPQTSF